MTTGIDDHNFIPYPDIDDKDFYQILYSKKEFNKTAYGSDFRYKTTEELCSRGEFKMQNHQEFIRNFISPETPYNGALLFHGTGVGKTCAAIGTTEGLRDYVKRNGKIYILSSENIRPNFYKELYDPGREAVEREFHGMPGSYQCAGDRYYPLGVSDAARSSAVNALIKQYYAFYGFGAFANFVDIGLGAKLPSHVPEAKLTNEDGSAIDIGEYFANSVIVIDEAHGIAGETKRMSKEEMTEERADQESEDEEAPSFQDEESGAADVDLKRKVKKAITNRSLFQVLLNTIIPACHAKGAKLKLILLTATPMKDNIQELADLLQLLNVNDGRMAPTDNSWRNTYFPKMTSDEMGEQITPEMVKGIKHLARGYVSYVKSNNPITFPKPLNPPAESLYEPAHDKSGALLPMFAYRGDSPDEDISDGYDIKLGNGDPFKFDLVKCPMSVYHFKCYITQLRGRGGAKSKSDSSDTHTRMASNFVYPHLRMDEFLADTTAIENLQTVYGNKGFDSCFRKQSVETAEKKRFTYYSYTQQALKAAGNFLKEDAGLALFSNKFHKFLNFVNEGPKGVVYAYSEFVKSGALIGALVLEANGFVRYTPNLKNHIDKKTGLPVANIQLTYPQAHILHLQDEHARVPAQHYRCALCGNVYNVCRASDGTEAVPKHGFKVATYVLVTAAIGSIGDIAEATNGNQDGSKIRVVLGTKTTGQGVDFKWVRQVHILDPWHNNTRIYQAIGRGLRHCSHADLPPAERNVTIYRYSSSAADIPPSEGAMQDPILIETEDGAEIDTGLIYRDLYTETVDEHMYQRVVRKDLVIKQIERILKIVAVDCELNRMRNQFPTDVDFSRECDYTMCKYTCEGFVEPIKYIRRIRRDATVDPANPVWVVIDDEGAEVHKENLASVNQLLNLVPVKKQGTIKSNQDLWTALHKTHKVISPGPGIEEMLVDLPLVEVDSSTYDIYFSAPQVDRAMKIITRVYHKSIAHTMEKLVYLVRQSDPELEDHFIYVAMDKLVGNPPAVKPVNFVDRYGRSGYLVYHNGYYIYQPTEIKDKSTPLFYRMRPIDIKRRFYSMDQLAPKPKEATYKVSSIDTARLDTLVDQFMGKQINSVLNLIEMNRALNGLLLAEHKYILETVITRIYRGETPGNGHFYMVEYYLRTGLLTFKGWERASGTDLATIFTDKDPDVVSPMHFISPDKSVLVYERRSGGLSWTSFDLSDITSSLTVSDRDLYYPGPPTFNGAPAVPRPVFPHLNLNETTSERGTGIYGFRSTTVTRDNKPLIGEGGLPSVLVDMVERINRNYPDSKTISLSSFKIIDETTKQETITKAATRSGRTKLRGLACSSAQETTTGPQIDRVRQSIIENYDTFTEGVTLEEFLNMAKMGPSVRQLLDRKSMCNRLEMLLMIADYYYIDGKKWNLNTIETEFYRPSTLKEPK
jgi:hypothetical protein